MARNYKSLFHKVESESFSWSDNFPEKWIEDNSSCVKEDWSHIDHLGDNIKKQIAEAIQKKTMIRERSQINSLEQGKIFIDTIIAEELCNFNIVTAQSDDGTYRILLASTFLQQKMANYIHEHFLKPGYVDQLPAFLVYYRQVSKKIIPPMFSAITRIDVTPKSQIKGFLSHAILLDFLSNKKRLKVVKLANTNIKALDLNGGVDIIAIDRIVTKREKSYVPVYLIDAKSFSGTYGDDIVAWFLEWRNHKLQNSTLYQRIEWLVRSNVNNQSVEVVPIRLIANTAFDHHFDDERKIKESVKMIEQNFDSKFDYLRNYIVGRVDERKTFQRPNMTEL